MYFYFCLDKRDNISVRRCLIISVLGVALMSAPAWGQGSRRGGASFGGAHGGFHSQGAGNVRTGSVIITSYGGYGGWGWRGSNYAYRYNHRHFYPGGYPWGWGYPGAYRYAWSPIPYWGWSYPLGGYTDPPQSDPPETQPASATMYPSGSNDNYYNGQIQQDEIRHLNQEVERLQEQEEERRSQESRATASSMPSGEALLVFRDKHTEEVQNYAVVGNTLWIFTELRSRKIPIASLDVSATVQANEERGIDFRLPK